jgi:hypothetical protein
MRLAPRAATLLALLTTASCAVVTDLGTGGYQLADAGSCEPSGDAGCASSVPSITCDCGSGSVCCLTPTSNASVTFACQTGSSCTGTTTVQLCDDDGGIDTECNGAMCVAQVCPYNGSSAMFHACQSAVLSLVCTPLPDLAE